MKDTKVQSMLRGRIGAAIMAMVSFLCITFGLSPEDSQVATEGATTIMNWVASGSVLAAGTMAFISKLRE